MKPCVQDQANRVRKVWWWPDYCIQPQPRNYGRNYVVARVTIAKNMQEVTEKPQHLRTGRIGEDIAVRWLAEKGFSILERNYDKKWGEIDIIAAKDQEIHFVEVKTISHETRALLEEQVSRGTNRPEENVHARKQQRLSRAIQTWMTGRGFTGNFRVDVLTARIVPCEKYAVVELIENVIFE